MRRRATASKRRSSSWASAPAIRSRARRSTSRSSGRAPTRGSPIFAKPRASSAASTSRRTSRRWSCPDRRRSARRPSAKDWISVFLDAGFEWRGAGCSMCLAMNPDDSKGARSAPRRRTATSRDGREVPTGRTLLMSPAMVAAAAVAGEIVDVREFDRWRLSRDRSRIRRHGAAAARRQHRHRPHHPGAVPASPCRSRGSSSICSKTIAPRRQRRAIPVSNPALMRRDAHVRRTRTSAAARRGSMRRRRSAAGAFAP